MRWLSFPFLPSGGEELRGAPLVYIPDLVKKFVPFRRESNVRKVHDIHMTQ